LGRVKHLIERRNESQIAGEHHNEVTIQSLSFPKAIFPLHRANSFYIGPVRNNYNLLGGHGFPDQVLLHSFREHGDAGGNAINEFFQAFEDADKKRTAQLANDLQTIRPDVLHVENHRRAEGQTQQPAGKPDGDRRVNAEYDVRLFGHQTADNRHKRVTQVIDASLESAWIRRDVNEGAPQVYAIEVTPVKQAAAVFRRYFMTAVVRHAGNDSDFVTQLHQIGRQVGHQRPRPRQIRMKPHVQDQHPHQTFSTR